MREGSSPAETDERRIVPHWALPVVFLVGAALGLIGGFVLGERPIVQEVVQTESPLAATTTTSTSATSELDVQTTESAPDEPVTTLDPDPLTIFVSPDGDDGSDGQTEATPFASIPRAIEALEPGMTLMVLPGTYLVEGSGPTLIPVVRNGTERDWTRIIGSGDERPVIVARGGALFEALGSYIEISGLELRGENFGPESSYGYGILFGDGHHFRAVNNVVSGFPVSGIGAVRTSHLYIANNWVFGNSQWGTEQGSGVGVFHATDYGFADDEFGYTDYFVNNVIFGNENLVTSRFVPGQITDGNGIIIDNNDETNYSGRTLVANNLIYGNGGRAIWAFGSSRVDIFNNTTLNNVLSGDALNGGRGEIGTVRGTDVRIVNNVAINDDGWETYIADGSDDLFFESNLSSGISLVETGGIVEFVGDVPRITSPGMDPSLLIPAADSAVVDAGSDIDLPLQQDVLGESRQSGGAVDIGAFEVN